MRRLQCALLAAIGVIGFASIASAADMPAKAPAFKAAPVAMYNWTGWYVGANFGGGWGRQSADYVANDASSAILFSPGVGGQPPATSFRTSGLLGGLQLGYNWQFQSKWLLGLEADFDWTNVKGSGAAPAAIIGNPVTATVEERIKNLGTLRARLGYLPMDNLLVFATGGLAYGKVERSGNYVMTAGGGVGVVGPPTFVCFAGAECFNGAASAWVAGWTAGGGLEYALSQRWTVKAEYLHVSLPSKSVTETATTVFPGSTPPLSTFNANFNRTSLDVVRIGVNFRL